MEKRTVRDLLLSVMLLLMICTSAATASPAPSFDPPTPESSAQPQASDLFTFTDYCAEVGASEHMQQWLSTVADMEKELIFYRWGLEERIRFVRGMHDAGYEMDSDLYDKLLDEDLDANHRIAAADEIIDGCYGEIKCRKDSYLGDVNYYSIDERLLTPETVGEAPPQILIFKEAFSKDFPDASEQEFLDAFAYWRRDIDRAVFRPINRFAIEGDRDEATAIALVDQYLENVFPWSIQTVLEAAVINVAWDYALSEEHDPRSYGVHEEYVGFPEDFSVMYFSARVDKKNIKPFPNQNTQGLFENRIARGEILGLGDSYQIVQVVGLPIPGTDQGVTGDEERAYYQTHYMAGPFCDYTASECTKIAIEGVMSGFGYSYKEADRYLVNVWSLHEDEDNNKQAVVLFWDHYLESDAVAWTYGAIVNVGTGELLDCFTLDTLRLRSPKMGNPDEFQPSSADAWWCPKTEANVDS